MGTDEGAVYLAKRLPKTIELLYLNIQGEQGMTIRGNYIFDHLLKGENEEDNVYCLPLLSPTNCMVIRRINFPEVQQFAKDPSGQRYERMQLWKTNENVNPWE